MYSDLGIAVALNLTLEERRERDSLNYNSLLCTKLDEYLNLALHNLFQHPTTTPTSKPLKHEVCFKGKSK